MCFSVAGYVKQPNDVLGFFAPGLKMDEEKKGENASAIPAY